MRGGRKKYKSAKKKGSRTLVLVKWRGSSGLKNTKQIKEVITACCKKKVNSEWKGQGIQKNQYWGSDLTTTNSKVEGEGTIVV